eukprot:scaffold8597_cov18-Tisochrysis_lutea.AAC.1
MAKTKKGDPALRSQVENGKPCTQVRSAALCTQYVLAGHRCNTSANPLLHVFPGPALSEPSPAAMRFEQFGQHMLLQFGPAAAGALLHQLVVLDLSQPWRWCPASLSSHLH